MTNKTKAIEAQVVQIQACRDAGVLKGAPFVASHNSGCVTITEANTAAWRQRVSEGRSLSLCTQHLKSPLIISLLAKSKSRSGRKVVLFRGMPGIGHPMQAWETGEETSPGRTPLY